MQTLVSAWLIACLVALKPCLIYIKTSIFVFVCQPQQNSVWIVGRKSADGVGESHAFQLKMYNSDTSLEVLTCLHPDLDNRIRP